MVAARVLEHHSAKPLAAVHNEIVSLRRLGNFESVRRKKVGVDLVFRDQPQERFHVPLFGPSHVTNGVISSLLFIIGIISAGSVRT